MRRKRKKSNIAIVILEKKWLDGTIINSQFFRAPIIFSGDVFYVTCGITNSFNKTEETIFFVQIKLLYLMSETQVEAKILNLIIEY